jgi:hypothetical protein
MIRVLIVIALLIFLVSMTTYEHMTNKDLVSALQKYGSKEDSKKKTDIPSQTPIYGPKAEPVVHPTPTKPSSKSNVDSTSVYPDIYGPDVVASPGEKIKHAKVASDNVDDETYDYNPDLAKAFPTSGPPQPFLTDFSKFQH